MSITGGISFCPRECHQSHGDLVGRTPTTRLLRHPPTTRRLIRGLGRRARARPPLVVLCGGRHIWPFVTPNDDGYIPDLRRPASAAPACGRADPTSTRRAGRAERARHPKARARSHTPLPRHASTPAWRAKTVCRTSRPNCGQRLVRHPAQRALWLALTQPTTTCQSPSPASLAASRNCRMSCAGSTTRPC